MSVTITLIGKDAATVKDDGSKIFGETIINQPVLQPKTVAPASTGHQLSLEQRVINLDGQTKVLYDRLEAIPKGDQTKVTIPQSLLDDVADMKTEITKNIDSLTQNHQDFNEFLKTHPTDEEIDAKMRILNNLISENKASIANAQKMVNANKAILDTMDTSIIPSTYRKMYRIMAGDSPSYNATDDILVFSKIGDMITLEGIMSNEASDNEIVFNDVDPYSFYIPEYRNDESPLRARLKAGGLDIQVDGENAVVKIFCTADPKNIGHIEWRTKWSTVSKN